MDRRTKKRVVAGGLVAVLLLLGIAMFAMFGQTFTVYFDPGTGGVLQYEGRRMESIEVSPRNPRRIAGYVPVHQDGKIFEGWRLSATATTNIYDTANINESRTLVAYWRNAEFAARLHVNGVHVRTVPFFSGDAFATLNTQTNDWIIPNTDYFTFHGWSFYDSRGNEMELRRIPTGQPNAGEWNIRQVGTINPPQLINDDNPFRPQTFGNIFHAILTYNPVGLHFHTSPNLATRITMDIDGQFGDTAFVAAPGFTNQSQIDNFVGWRLARHTELEGFSPNGGHLPIPARHLHQFDTLTNSFTTIERFNNAPANTLAQDAQIQMARLNEIFNRTYKPGEAFEIDPLLFYISTRGFSINHTLGIHFLPVFGSDLVPDAGNNDQLFFLRDDRIPGMERLVQVTTTSGDDIPAFLQGGQISFTDVGIVGGRMLAGFSFTNEGIIHTIPTHANLPVNDSRLTQNGSNLFTMIWQDAPGQNVVVNFDFGTEHGSNLIFIGQGAGFISSQDVISQLGTIIARPGDFVIMPSTSMFGVPGMTFGHWQAEDGTIIGGAGAPFQVNSGTYQITAVWINNQSMFAFNLNGGRPGPDFNPDPGQMTITVNQAGQQLAQIPTGRPIRYGYEFTGWRIEGGVSTLLQPGANILVTARRQILVAQWTPMAVSVHLEFSFVNVGLGQVATPANVQRATLTLNVPFDSFIQLPRISRIGDALSNLGAPLAVRNLANAYTDAVQHVGWHFADNRVGSNSPITILPEERIHINEAFAIRNTGSTSDTVLATSGVRATDLKAGLQRDVQIIDSVGSQVTGLDAFRLETQTWEGGFWDVMGNTPVLNTQNDRRITRTDMLARLDARTGITYNRYRQHMMTHTLAGFIYLPTTQVGALGLTTATGWLNAFNPATGTYDGATTAPFVHRFNAQGVVYLPAPMEHMTLFLLWQRNAIEIRVLDNTHNLMSTVQSYHNDNRDHAQLDGTFFQSFVNALPVTERFSRWQVTFFFEFPNGNTYSRNVGNLEEWLFAGGHASIIQPNVGGANPLNLTSHVHRIDVRLVVQDLNSLIVRASHEGEHHGVIRDPLPAQIYADGGSVFNITSLRTGTPSMTIEFGVCRVLAQQIQRASSQRIVAYSTNAGDNARFQANQANPGFLGHVFLPGQQINLFVTPVATFGHSPSWISGGFIPGQSVAQINADSPGTLILHPIFAQVEYSVYINFDADASFNPSAIPGGMGSLVTVNNGVGQIAIPGSFTQFQNFVLNTPSFGVGPGIQLWDAIRNSRMGHYIDTTTPPDAVVNLGVRNQANQIIPRHSLNHSVGMSFTQGAGSLSAISMNYATGENFDEIHLYVLWRVQTVNVRFEIWRDGSYQTIATVNRPFGESLTLHNGQPFINERRGFQLTGWNVMGRAAPLIGSHFALSVNVMLDGNINPGSIDISEMPISPGNHRVREVVFRGFHQGHQVNQIQVVLHDWDFGHTEIVYLDNYDLTNPFRQNVGNPFTLQSFTGTWIVGGDPVWITRQIHTLSWGPARFGDRVFLDFDSQNFTQYLLDPLTGNRIIPNESSGRLLEYWFWRDGNGVERRLERCPEGGHFIRLDDDSMLNALGTAFAVPGLLQIFPRFSDPSTGLLDITGLRGTSNIEIGTNAGDLQNVEDMEELIREHIIRYTTDFAAITPLNGMTLEYTIGSPTGINLYQEFIHNPGTVDNRFIRWGWEMVGFYAYVNNGDRNEPLTREEFRVGDTLTHTFLIPNNVTRPSPLVIRPIWEPIPFVAVIESGVPGGTLPAGVTWGTNFTVRGTSGMGGVYDTLDGFFGSTINLPLLNVNGNFDFWHTDFVHRATPASPILIENVVSWANFENFLVAWDRETIEAAVFHPSGNFSRDTLARSTWPRIYFRGIWDVTANVTVNHNVVMPNAAGVLQTHAVALNPQYDTQIQNVIAARNPNTFITSTFSLRPDVVRVEVGTNQYVYRYVTETVPTLGQQLPSSFRLPSLEHMSIELSNLGIAENLYGMQSRGWFHTNLDAANRIGNENDVLWFNGPVHGTRHTAFSAFAPAWTAPRNITAPGSTTALATVNLFYVFEFVTGHMYFDLNGGLVGGSPSAARVAVTQNDQVNMANASQFPIPTREGYIFQGWEFVGGRHVIGGTMTLVTNYGPAVRNGILTGYTGYGNNGSPAFIENAGRRYGAHTGNLFTVMFVPHPDDFVDVGIRSVHQDGMAIQMRAVWVDRFVPVVFHDAYGNPLGSPFAGIQVREAHAIGNPTQNTDFYNAVFANDAPVPTRIGHTFAGWYRVRTTRVVSAQVLPILTQADYNTFLAAHAINAGSFVTPGAQVFNLYARFVPNYVQFSFNLVGESLPGNATIPNTASLRYGQMHANVLPDPTVFTINDAGFELVGWTTDPNNPLAPTFDPRITRNLFLHDINSGNMSAGGYFSMNVATPMGDSNTQRTSMVSTTVYPGTYVFNLNLYAVWQANYITVTYTSGLGQGSDVIHTGFLFSGNIRNAVGGEGAAIVGPERVGYRRFGMMIIDDAGFQRPGHNFLGWRALDRHENAFTEGPLANRIFFPGEFIPSIRESIYMEAIWVAQGPNMTQLTTIPALPGVSILSMPAPGGGINANFFYMGGRINTHANIVLIPRGFTVMPRESITLTNNNVIHVGLPTAPTRANMSAAGLRLESGAIVAHGLRTLYVNDSLIGVTRDGTNFVNSRGSLVYNIVMAPVVRDLNGRHWGRGIFREYIVMQGNLIVDVAPNNTISNLRYVGRSTKYAYEESINNVGMLFTRTHNENLQQIGGAVRELVAVPGAWGNGNGINNTTLMNVQRIRSNAFLTFTGCHETDYATDLTFDARWLNLQYDRHAFFHTVFANMHFAGTMHHEFISGFNPFLIDVQIATDSHGIGNYAASRITVVPYNTVVRGGCWNCSGHSSNNPHNGLWAITVAGTGGTPPRPILGWDQSIYSQNWQYLVYIFGMPEPITGGGAVCEVCAIGSSHFTIFTGTAIATGPMMHYVINDYAFYNFTHLPWENAVLNFRFDAWGALIGNLRFEYFGAPIFGTRGIIHVPDAYWSSAQPFGINPLMTIPPLNIQIDWQVFSEVTLDFMSLFGVRDWGNWLLQQFTFNNMTTSVTGPENRFPIFVNNYSWLRSTHGQQLVNGTSRFQPIFTHAQFAVGETTDSQMQQAATIYFGETLTFPSMWNFSNDVGTAPYYAKREAGYTFVGWRLNLTPEQSSFIAGSPTHLMFAPGETRRRGLEFNDTTIALDGGTRFFAVWRKVLVQFDGRLSDDDQDRFAAELFTDIEVYIVERDGLNNPYRGDRVGLWDIRLSTPGTEIFMPGHTHTFIEGVSNRRMTFTGWISYSDLGDNLGYWNYNNNFAGRILPDGFAIFELGTTVTRFHALYDYSNVEIANQSGTFTVTGFTTAANYNVTNYVSVPHAVYHQGFMHPVTHIAPRAFFHETGITQSIRLSDSIRVIGNQAFERTNAGEVAVGWLDGTSCHGLHFSGFPHLVEVGETLVIGTNAFAYNYNLGGAAQTRTEYLNVSLNLPWYTTSIGHGAFRETRIHRVCFGGFGGNISSLQYIHDSAFEGARGLSHIGTFPSTLRHVGEHAFTHTQIGGPGNPGFTTQNVPASFQFHDQSNILFVGQISGSPNGRAYVAVNGHLTRVSQLDGLITLVVYATGNINPTFDLESLVVGQFVVSDIGHNAFAHHRHLQNIILPESIMGRQVRVGDSAFAFMRAPNINIFVGHSSSAFFNSPPVSTNAFRNAPLTATIRLVNITGAAGSRVFTNGSQSLAEWQTSFPTPTIRILFTTNWQG
ncbi:MAG: leucine-rich repeat domain-containing protein [Firmicutes bacterium]|nr:leucine-rich repeat domain-containing protein [Bacillota bacterium]